MEKLTLTQQLVLCTFGVILLLYGFTEVANAEFWDTLNEQNMTATTTK